MLHIALLPQSHLNFWHKGDGGGDGGEAGERGGSHAEAHGFGGEATLGSR